MPYLQKRTRDPQSEAWACIPLEVEFQAAQMRLAIKASGIPARIVREESGSQKFVPGRWEIIGDESLDKGNGESIAISTLFWDLESKGWRIAPCPSRSKFSQWIAEIISPILANQVSTTKR